MALVAEDVTFGYRRGRAVVDSVSLSLEAGKVTVIVGPNGAGKSTFLRLLLGLLRPQSGRVLLDGEDVARIPARVRARRLAYVPQRTSLAFGFSVREYVGLGAYATGGGGGGGGDVDDVLRRVDLADRAEDPLAILSAGQQQRATLARALAQIGGVRAGVDGPEGGVAAAALLADEPVSAMDPRHALLAMSILRDLAEGGLAVAVVLHDLTLAARFCDRALVLDERGRAAAAGAVSEALIPEILSEVFGVGFEAVSGMEGRAVLLPSALRGH